MALRRSFRPQCALMCPKGPSLSQIHTDNENAQHDWELSLGDLPNEPPGAQAGVDRARSLTQHPNGRQICC